jgi:DNA uptake protein ComE-like DNA-binding protein
MVWTIIINFSMKFLTIFLTFLLTVCTVSTNKMEYTKIAKEIIELQNADLELRDKLIQNGQLFEGYNNEMEALHNRNAETLNNIIDKIGYPTVNKVGKEANEAAWLVIQHSIGQPEFMKKCAVFLEKAVDENQANAKQLAYLTDRIAGFEGRPQLYGTQFDWDAGGEINPKSFDDLEKVNQRRKTIGLNLLEEQTQIIRKQVIAENQKPPADMKERTKQIDEWRKNVGWIK